MRPCRGLLYIKQNREHSFFLLWINGNRSGLGMTDIRHAYWRLAAEIMPLGSVD